MTVEELKQNPNFERWISLEHKDILPFVQREFGKKAWLIQGYILLNILLLALMIVLGAWQASKGIASTGNIILYSILGFAITLTLLIPVHEGIHGLAYKLLGAPKVKYGSDIRKFIFYAMADHFVAGSRDFTIVALAPFILINFLAVLGIFYVSLNYQWLLLGVLLMHTGACAGDFAMLSFLMRHKEEEVYTYDDVENNISYFYRARKSEEEE